MYKVACAIEEYVVIFYQAEVVTMNIHTLTAEDQTMTNSRETAKATKLWRFKIDQYGEGECYIHDELGYYVGQVKDTLTAQEIVKAVNGMNGNLWECVNAFLEINGYRYPVESKNHSALSYYVSQIEKCVLEDSANINQASK